jgi:hypothetical protein
MAWELKVMQDGGPVTPKPNAVKVPLTTKKAGKTNSSEQEEPEGNQKSISLQLEQECLVNKWTPSYHVR